MINIQNDIRLFFRKCFEELDQFIIVIQWNTLIIYEINKF